jgi:hypothetical protein
VEAARQGTRGAALKPTRAGALKPGDHVGHRIKLKHVMEDQEPYILMMLKFCVQFSGYTVVGGSQPGTFYWVDQV